MGQSQRVLALQIKYWDWTMRGVWPIVPQLEECADSAKQLADLLRKKEVS